MVRISLLRQVRWAPPNLSARMLIKWWMIIRTVLVSTTMAVVWYFSAPATLVGSLILPATVVVVTALVSWFFYRSVRSGQPPELHFYLNYFIDVSLITLINLITQPADVNFVPLYVLGIAIASILSFRPGALFTATLASVFYLPVGLRMLSLGVTFSRAVEINILYPENRLMFLNIGLQVFLFYAVALITSFLSQRLRSAGTELEDVRRLLRQHRLDTNQILGNIASGLVTCNTSQTVVYANQAALRIFEMRRDELLEYGFPDLFDGVCPDLTRIVFLATQAGIVVTRRVVELRTTGKGIKTLAVSSSLLKDGGGELRGVSVVFDDISHEIKARELEMRSSRLEAVAELAASLAHEIKNPLASIRSAVEILRDGRQVEPAERQDKLMECILTESDRLSELLRQFLQFSSHSFGPAENVRMGDVLDEVLESAGNHPQWRGDIRVTVEPGVQGMAVCAPRTSLVQIFYNLLINAAQAGSPEQGQVSRITIGDAERRRRRRPAEGPGFYLVSVRDDGPGVDSKVRERIFEPFFTTRRGGFGLGLAVVYRIVSSLGGFIDIAGPEETDNGDGAEFILSLPRADRSAGSGAEAGKSEKGADSR